MHTAAVETKLCLSKLCYLVWRNNSDSSVSCGGKLLRATPSPSRVHGFKYVLLCYTKEECGLGDMVSA